MSNDLRIDPVYGVVTAGSDGGDSLQRTYSVFLLRLISLLNGISVPNYPKLNSPTENQFEISPGRYVRFPQPGLWTFDSTNVSRDQLTPVICYYALSASTGNVAFRRVLTSLMWEVLKRGSFAQNIHANYGSNTWKIPDLITPDLWAIAARAYVKSVWAPIAIPVILFGDLFSVFGSAIKVIATTKPTDVDDTNQNNVLMTQQAYFSTPFSCLARKIYNRFRRQNAGNTQLGETSAVMGAIAYYNVNDNPGITELSRPLVAKY